MPAPKGNTNALKHGLYAKRFTARERARLSNIDPRDITGESDALRITVDHILADLQKLDDLELKAKMTNSLINAVATLAALARTYDRVNARHSPMLEGLEQALKRFRDEQGL
jgi:hypothetical protein